MKKEVQSVHLIYFIGSSHEFIQWIYTIYQTFCLLYIPGYFTFLSSFINPLYDNDKVPLFKIEGYKIDISINIMSIKKSVATTTNTRASLEYVMFN